ncbi:MAG: DEAD/DEAH box helicase [Burkholderiales bacterium]
MTTSSTTPDLTAPEVRPADTAPAAITLFSELALDAPLLRVVAEEGYTTPTPIQAQAIPLILAGRDVMGGAQTGTGKTAGFTLPILQRLLKYASTSTSPARHPIRALILAPTRELAVQVEESVTTYAKYTGLRATCIYGGVNMDPQIAALRTGIEVVVATPGRFLDHVQQRTINLQQVEFFVLDEADRMLDMGFIPDVKRIIALLPTKRQSLLFSATFPEDIKKLADSFLKDPVLVQVARRNQANESISHLVHPVAREKKRELLVHIVKTRNMHQVLVFTATRLGCNRLAYQLNKDGVHAAAIHGDKTQTERTEALEAFKAGKVGVLVATDVAARGLDIDQLPAVINFDLPNSPEDYVHRIGRTGRAGRTGEAISLVCPEEHEKLADIERMIKTKITREVIQNFELPGREAAGLLASPRESSGERSERPARGGDRGGERSDRGGERSDRGASRERRPEREARPDRGDRLTSPRPSAAPSDPIFSKPYEPGALPTLTRPTPPAKRPQGQVAALLGGLPKRT